MNEWMNTRTIAGDWGANDRPLSIAIVAPKNCGKTAYLAALRHISQRASIMIRDASYRFARMTGHGKLEGSARDATKHLEDVYAELGQGFVCSGTPAWYAYHGVAERHHGGRVSERHVHLLDAQGGSLFPASNLRADRGGLEGGPPPLMTRLERLGLSQGDHALMVFINEPRPGSGSWQIRHQVPAALAEYLQGMHFERVILYVACADELFPRKGNLHDLLDAYNFDAEAPAALRRYVDYFRGSPQCDFMRDLIQYLAHTGLVSQENGVGSRVAVFWGSSLGVKRYSGHANVKMDKDASKLDDTADWIPVQVLEPILWCAGLLEQSGGAR